MMANPMNTEVTEMMVVSNGLGPPKSIVAPAGGGIEGNLLNSAGPSFASWAAMLRPSE